MALTFIPFFQLERLSLLNLKLELNEEIATKYVPKNTVTKVSIIMRMYAGAHVPVVLHQMHGWSHGAVAHAKAVHAAGSGHFVHVIHTCDGWPSSAKDCDVKVHWNDLFGGAYTMYALS
jgi:hypothetical protein